MKKVLHKSKVTRGGAAKAIAVRHRQSPAASAGGSAPVAKETLSDIMGIRVAPTFKTWVFAEMDKMGVPERARAEFLRGCLVYAIKSSRRPSDPKWTAFTDAAEGAAVTHLGAKLALEGPRDIAALGFWPAA
jgi:hypothetical protein